MTMTNEGYVSSSPNLHGQTSINRLSQAQEPGIMLTLLCFVGRNWLLLESG